MTFGFSRDDVNTIIHNYVDNHIIDNDPFNTIDQGVLDNWYAPELLWEEQPNLTEDWCLWRAW